jgi:tartrate-resistant acid phosphatase type 5
MAEKQTHLEQYVYLPGLSHNAALIAWGGFFFKVKGELEGGKWKLVDDEDLPQPQPGRLGTIGVSSKPFGAQAKVFVFEEGGEPDVPIFVGNTNHAIVRGLKPDTEYRYRVVVRNEAGQDVEWGAGTLRDWTFINGQGALRKSERKYENKFRTFPDPNTSVENLTFAVLGDFGRGVRKPSKDEMCQREIAEAIEHAVSEHDVRLVLTTGDNIYRGGNEDDDWFFTYFQPYRHIINRVPVFTSFGNHDDDETEEKDDRDELDDNFYVVSHFTDMRDRREASINPGLFYRVKYGSDIEFICLDTSKETGKRYFEMEENRDILDRLLSMPPPKWRIPFFHHPPFCAGPKHFNKESVEEQLVPRFEESGIRVVFNGHEHNFQHSRNNRIDYFVTGGGGQYRKDEPKSDKFASAKTQAWGGNEGGHFLLVKIEGSRMTINPYGGLKDNKLKAIDINRVTGDQGIPPFVVKV